MDTDSYCTLTSWQTVQRHFSSENYDIHRTRITLNHALPEPQVSIHFHNQLQHGWTATKEGAENVVSRCVCM